MMLPLKFLYKVEEGDTGDSSIHIVRATEEKDCFS